MGTLARSPLLFASTAAAAAFALLACDSSTDPEAGCSGGKCDGLEVLARVVTGPVVECVIVVAPAADTLHCRGIQLPTNSSTDLGTVFISTDRDDTDAIAFSDDGDQLRVVTTLAPNQYPVTVTVTTEVVVGERAFYQGQKHRIASRPSASGPAFSVTPPFDLLPIGVWPDDELVAAGTAGTIIYVTEDLEHTFPITSTALGVSGVGPDTEITYLHELLLAPPYTARRAQVFHIPVAKTAVTAPSLAIGFIAADGSGGNVSDRVVTALNGAGYYLLGLDGHLTLTARGSLPGLEDIGGSADAGADETPDAGTDLPQPDAAPVDPCASACTTSQVCVAGACVARSGQSQSQFCGAATAVCDANEDEDCAADHACAGGICRRLTCQGQSEFCGTASGVCDPDDDGDCPSGHACAEGICRRLTCQGQSQFCGTASGVCDPGDDSDCPSEQVCVDSRCRRLTCQGQSEFCGTASGVCEGDDDGDCPAAHACAVDRCRRLTCQSQSQFCSTATGLCDTGDDGDCPAEHSCVEGVCERTSCQ